MMFCRDLVFLAAASNSVGKSTFASLYLQLIPDCREIIDPDAIARTLSGMTAGSRQIRAGRMAIERTKQLIENRDSFAIETTMSGTVLSQTLGQAADAGYYIAIKLLRVETVDVSSKRVARRVQQGGHDIPMADQIRGGQ
jgi:predicted ABC-type ATPase